MDNSINFLGEDDFLSAMENENKKHHHKSVQELQDKFDNDKKIAKDKIREEPNKHKRFWKWVWYYLTFPFKWIWVNIRDFRTMLIFIIVMLLVSIEVWLPYLMGVITWGSDFSKWCFGIGSACWIFWIGPGTPFIPLCIVITIGIKTAFDKLKQKKHNISSD